MDNVVYIKEYVFRKKASSILKDLEELLNIATKTEQSLTKYEKYDIVSKWILDLREYKNAFKEHIIKQKAILKRIEESKDGK